jgi:hypothetical protein
MNCRDYEGSDLTQRVQNTVVALGIL